jgi:hypothetical protein
MVSLNWNFSSSQSEISFRQGHVSFRLAKRNEIMLHISIYVCISTFICAKTCTWLIMFLYVYVHIDVYIRVNVLVRVRGRTCKCTVHVCKIVFIKKSFAKNPEKGGRPVRVCVRIHIYMYI